VHVDLHYVSLPLDRNTALIVVIISVPLFFELIAVDASFAKSKNVIDSSLYLPLLNPF
jgi:hypothetical protein